MNDVRTAKSVDEEPHVTLTEWMIIHANDTGCLHFIGRKPDGKGRITTAIQEFDIATMSGRTESGRHYKLEGKQAEDHTPAAVVIAGTWGPQMLTRVTAIDVDDIPIMMPARGMA